MLSPQGRGFSLLFTILRTCKIDLHAEDTQALMEESVSEFILYANDLSFQASCILISIYFPSIYYNLYHRQILAYFQSHFFLKLLSHLYAGLFYCLYIECLLVELHLK